MLGPVAAYLPTPRNPQGRLNVDVLQRLTTRATRHGAHSIAVLGSVGGAPYMPRAMRKKTIQAAAEVTTDTNTPLIAGIGALNTAEVLANLEDAYHAGATAALLQPMAYHPLLDTEIHTLYATITDITPIPIWIYNNPRTTQHHFSALQLADLAHLPNIGGFKDRAANPSDITHRINLITRHTTHTTLDFGFSGEDKGADILLNNAHTWHSALAGIMPELTHEIAGAAMAGRDDESAAEYARSLQKALTPLTVIFGQYGGIRTVHAIAEHRGMDLGELPSPLGPMPSAAQGLLSVALRSLERAHESLTLRAQTAETNAVPREGGRRAGRNVNTAKEPTRASTSEYVPRRAR
ncbi:dihydrodipicolinate synthetase [Jonesia denitrificans DSM 20603]|uniref:Dihydrodipicolinate synthetase n=1 Tax=Jonesia denitrificans (strain ATCC 14870 / DSM 20603 / BCRC 15368 / CIP 55.134 / JCM 11481 / NBRC 15587 / NCTC 10816 / Prevot 55134) TaxID=471856 RepID=C7R3Y7_JONDD|nr:dihydrodipicolinate synthetase [Jonesia denitrificans DSM 20603]SQH20832.1 Dihydrodipicolinate synthase [Jonesia denitrificans]